MKHLLILAVVLGWSLAAGYLDFERAFLEQSPGLTAARSEVQSAQLKVEALADDPYASPFERQAAIDELVRAQARLKERLADMRTQAFRRYAAVLVARAQLERARSWTEQTRIAYEAAKIKAREGALAAYEAEKARIAWEDAQLALARAEAQLKQAEAELARYGDFAADEVPDFPIPERLSVEAHPSYLQAKLDVRTAERSYRAAQGPDTSRQQRNWFLSRLESAKNRMKMTDAALSNELDLRKAAIASAKEALALKRDALNARRQAYEAAKLRHGRGLISELTLKQAEFALSSAELDYVKAQVALQEAKLALLPFEVEP